MYYNLFFIKESYHNYDRESVLTACVLLSLKANNLHEMSSSKGIHLLIECQRKMAEKFKETFPTP